ncbi:hypothetical protein V2J09_014107 [Rumex salicifolius]
MAFFSVSNSGIPPQFVSAPKSTLVSCRLPFSGAVQFATTDGLYSTSDWTMLVSGQCKDKASSQKVFRNSYCKLKVNALFWSPKKTEKVTDFNLSLGDFLLKGSGSEQTSGNSHGPRKISVSVISSISEVSPKDWDECATDASSSYKLNPFIMHDFLSCLEESNCSVKETGWSPAHIIAKDEFNNVLGVVPLYLKSHSLGEYVFDHSWADAYYTYGSRYYPKLQCCVPFSPVTGPRILVRNNSYRDEMFDILVSALKEITLKFRVSSLHLTFSSKSESDALKTRGFLQRIGLQYHWKNHNYNNFDEFLMDLKQNKRKNIRQERKKISAQNLTMKRLRGHEIKPNQWDTFYHFYRNTTDNKLSLFL